MISDRDLLQATARREKEERLLYYADFAGECWDHVVSYFHITDPEAFYREMGIFKPQMLTPMRKPDAPLFDYSSYFEGIAIPEGVKIEDDGVLNLPAHESHFVHLISPLRNVYDFEEILKFPIFKKKEYYDFSNLKEQVDEIHARGQVAHAFVGRLFESSWPLRGYENMLADMLAEPEIAEYFLKLQLDWNIAYATAAAEAGADMVSFGDDVGSQTTMTFSAELWREMLKPKWAETFAAVKKINPNVVIWYHSCGHVTEIIPDLIEVGLDILNPIQPECMDIYEIQKKYGHALSFDGGLGTQLLMPFGTPDEVAAEVTRLVEVFGANGGYILAPAHVLEPEVPPKNIDAFLETAKKVCFR